MPFTTPRALVLLRVARGGAPPTDVSVREAIARDRIRLALPPESDAAHRVAGPYAVDVDGQAFDEYVAWEI